MINNLGLAKGNSDAIQATSIDLQARAIDLLASIGTPTDQAIYTGNDPSGTAHGLANTIDTRQDTALTKTASLQTLSVRLEIEETLAEAPKSSLALFSLPPRKAYLETVRDIVTSTIVNELAAGQGIIGGAQEDLAAGNKMPWPRERGSPTSSTPQPTATRWARARRQPMWAVTKGWRSPRARSAACVLLLAAVGLRGSSSSAALCNGFGVTEISRRRFRDGRHVCDDLGLRLLGSRRPHGQVRRRLADHRLAASNDASLTVVCRLRRRRLATSASSTASPGDGKRLGRDDDLHVRRRACDHEDAPTAEKGGTSVHVTGSA